MRLYIIRHAIAVEAEKAEADNQRPLSGKGRKKMAKIARGLRQLEEHLDLILTSPYLRAAQTAEILRKTYKLDLAQLAETEHLAPMDFADQLIEEIRDNYSEAERIALIGHEPYLSQMISVLTSGDAGMTVNFKKGGVCRLSVAALQYGKCATLDWILFPSQLVEIGKQT